MVGLRILQHWLGPGGCRHIKKMITQVHPQV
jgi:hypothetical protein